MTSLLRAFTLALKHDFKQKQEKISSKRGCVNFSPFVPDSLVDLLFSSRGNDRSKLGNKICTTSRWRWLYVCKALVLLMIYRILLSDNKSQDLRCPNGIIYLGLKLEFCSVRD